MKFLLVLFFAIISLSAFAGFEGLSSGTSLNVFNKINCSTGLTCTRVKDKFTIVSSPTISTGTLTISGAEGADAILALAADEADDNGDTWKLKSVATGNSFSIFNNVSGSDVSKFSIATDGTTTIVGDLLGSGTAYSYGFKKKQVAIATNTTLTISQCGSTFINSAAAQVNLPEASTALGCSMTFITGNASNFDVNPDDSDKILVYTDGAGDRIRNATSGNSITIQAISGAEWAPTSIIGTWSDVN